MPQTRTKPLRLGVITGLKKEIACLRPERRADGLALWCEAVAGRPDKATEMAARMVAEGATALMSFGIAGGLDPSLGAGMVVLGSEVLDTDGNAQPAYAPWVRALINVDGSFDAGPILGSDHPIMTPQQKQILFRRTKALCVDMESHAVAAVARKAAVPFLAVRAIGDHARRTIPGSAIGGLAPDGSTRALPVVRALVRRPHETAELWRLARDTNRALAALKKFAEIDLAAALAT